ncbi:hypothetical protein A2335_00230 [Candidatus Peregrinibacteria bacterium RIFOXYB2_FULL_32_7]|nr:MAG: hypothetical protein A2335_00230 [Candidatus Peregrinibacteria bacterium RIFOXYB2_FULL_32_7]
MVLFPLYLLIFPIKKYLKTKNQMIPNSLREYAASVFRLSEISLLVVNDSLSGVAAQFINLSAK